MQLTSKTPAAALLAVLHGKPDELAADTSQLAANIRASSPTDQCVALLAGLIRLVADQPRYAPVTTVKLDDAASSLITRQHTELFSVIQNLRTTIETYTQQNSNILNELRHLGVVASFIMQAENRGFNVRIMKPKPKKGASNGKKTKPKAKPANRRRTDRTRTGV